MISPKDLLPKLVQDLTAMDVPFAVIGGLAVSVHAEERFTKDVDFSVLVKDEQAGKKVLERLIDEKGYRPGEGFFDSRTEELRGARMYPPEAMGSEVPVDLLFSTCGIEHEAVRAARPLEVLGGVPVVTRGHLIAMKVLSADDIDRRRDFDDLSALVKLADENDMAQARQALDLMAERGYGFALGKDDLQAELDQVCQLYAPHLVQDKGLGYRY